LHRGGSGISELKSIMVTSKNGITGYILSVYTLPVVEVTYFAGMMFFLSDEAFIRCHS
jgi:hypothetical protein